MIILCQNAFRLRYQSNINEAKGHNSPLFSNIPIHFNILMAWCQYFFQKNFSTFTKISRLFLQNNEKNGLFRAKMNILGIKMQNRMHTANNNSRTFYHPSARGRKALYYAPRRTDILGVAVINRLASAKQNTRRSESAACCCLFAI